MKNVPRKALAEIDRKLSKAVELLNAAARDLRDTGFNPRENITKIGSALVAVFEVQHQIYRRVPALAPQWIRDRLAPDSGISTRAPRSNRSRKAS